MRVIIFAPALAGVLLLAAAAWLLSQPARSPLHVRFAHEAGELLASVPDDGARSGLATRATGAADLVGRFLDARAVGLQMTARPALLLATLRGAIALSVLPLLGAAIGVGILAGLLRRHLLREDFGFHSATFSYVGKLLFAGCLGAYAWTALSPLGPPLWTLYLFTLGGSLGAGLYVGNLPPRL